MCHQTVSLTARHLESIGIPTVVIGSAWDIVTTCRVPRFLYNDLPLGNPLGAPWERDAQLASVRAALSLVDAAEAPVAVKSDLRWDDDGRWKDNYMRLASPAEMLAMGDENRARRRAQIKAGLRRPPLD